MLKLKSRKKENNYWPCCELESKHVGHIHPLHCVLSSSIKQMTILSFPWFGQDTAAAKLLQSCLTLCDPIDGSPPGSPVPRILQARTLEWVAISFSKAWRWKVKVKSLSQVWLSDPMDCSLPGSSVHGIFQARVLEWGAIAFSNLALQGPYCCTRTTVLNLNLWNSCIFM